MVPGNYSAGNGCANVWQFYGSASLCRAGNHLTARRLDTPHTPPLGGVQGVENGFRERGQMRNSHHNFGRKPNVSNECLNCGLKRTMFPSVMYLVEDKWKSDAPPCIEKVGPEMPDRPGIHVTRRKNGRFNIRQWAQNEAGEVFPTRNGMSASWAGLREIWVNLGYLFDPKEPTADESPLAPGAASALLEIIRKHPNSTGAEISVIVRGKMTRVELIKAMRFLRDSGQIVNVAPGSSKHVWRAQ